MDAKTEIKTLQHFIGGEWADAEDGETFEDINPLDDSLYCHVAKGSGDDIARRSRRRSRSFRHSRRQRQPSANAGCCGSPKSWRNANPSVSTA